MVFVKVCYSDVSAFQMFAIQIPTVQTFCKQTSFRSFEIWTHLDFKWYVKRIYLFYPGLPLRPAYWSFCWDERGPNYTTGMEALHCNQEGEDSEGEILSGKPMKNNFILLKQNWYISEGLYSFSLTMFWVQIRSPNSECWNCKKW